MTSLWRPWTRQPQSAVRLNLAHPLARRINGTLWSTGQTWGDQNGWALSGTGGRLPFANSVGFAGDGTTGYMSRSISLDANRPHVLMCIFAERTASTTARTLYGLGTNASSLGALCRVYSGSGSSAVVCAQMRNVDSSAKVCIATGPAAERGRVYACAWFATSVYAANNFLLVNGTQYSSTTDLDVTETTPTLVHESVGALRRGAVADYSADSVLFTARFVPIVGEPFTAQMLPILQEWTAHPWELFAPRRIYYPVSTAAAATYTLTSAGYVPGSLTSSSVTPRIVRTKA